MRREIGRRPQFELLEGRSLLSATAQVVGHTLRIAVHQDNLDAAVFWKDSTHRQIYVEFYAPQTGEIRDLLFDAAGITSVSARVVGDHDGFVADFEDPTGLLPTGATMIGDHDTFLGHAEADTVTMVGADDTADGGGGPDTIRIVGTA